jgi:hypothetical protein
MVFYSLRFGKVQRESSQEDDLCKQRDSAPLMKEILTRYFMLKMRFMTSCAKDLENHSLAASLTEVSSQTLSQVTAWLGVDTSGGPEDKDSLMVPAHLGR